MNEEFLDPRLARVYDALDPDRSDLAPYLDTIRRLGAQRVLDVGCGTGTFALLLADRGLDVVGVDPAPASLDVARAKPGAERVRWVDGDIAAVDGVDFDVATMTANVAMFLQMDDEARATLEGIAAALRPGGHLLFESRRPDAHAWEGWTPESTRSTALEADGTPVDSWIEVIQARWPWIDFRNVFAFRGRAPGILVSASTLRYRELDEWRVLLDDAGLDLIATEDAPDRPGREWLFRATRKLP